MTDVYVDGSCKSNKNGAVGVYIRCTTAERRLRLYDYKFVKDITSNKAEYLALQHALELLLVMRTQVTKNIKIYSDSMLVVNRLNNHWDCKSVYLRVTHMRCVKLLSELKEVCGKKVKIKWISRRDNRIADKLSKKKLKWILHKEI